MASDELESEVETFLDGADAVYDEYEQGYMNADAAMDILDSHIEALREAYEEETQD